MNLLLVDDHTLFREGLRGLLANISPGVAIHEAASVDDAVEACRTTPFRMVLLDLGLTSTSGLDTLDRFRASIPDVPVVVLSGDQEPRHIRSTHRARRSRLHSEIAFHGPDDRSAALRPGRRRLFATARDGYAGGDCRGVVHAAVAAPAASLATAAARAARTK